MDDLGYEMARVSLMEVGLTEDEADDMIFEYDYLFED